MIVMKTKDKDCCRKLWRWRKERKRKERKNLRD